ncbi:hypothetical protein L1887_34991 [Cichorium endivia]|nr:hypothetical protein L1887_34991 [Cichorium endivia]
MPAPLISLIGLDVSCRRLAFAISLPSTRLRHLVAVAVDFSGYSRRPTIHRINDMVLLSCNNQTSKMSCNNQGEGIHKRFTSWLD